MTFPLISVIIPTHNCAAYLPEALNSALSQTYPRIEILVVDDGSTDNTAAIMARYADQTIYRQEQSGPSCARNRGIAKATGPYIAFLDADDIWVPSKLEKQFFVFDQHPETGLVYSRSVGFSNETGEKLGVYPKTVYSGMLFDRLLVAPLFYLPSVITKTRILTDLGGFDEDLITAEDTHLYLRIARCHSIIGIPDILVRRRIHNKNLSYRSDINFGTLSCLDRIAHLYPETHPRVYPAMLRAYRNRGTSLMLEYFNSGAYGACHRTAQRLLNLRIWDAKILLCFVLTFFPGRFIESVRFLRRQLWRA